MLDQVYFKRARKFVLTATFIFKNKSNSTKIVYPKIDTAFAIESPELSLEKQGIYLPIRITSFNSCSRVQQNVLYQSTLLTYCSWFVMTSQRKA